MSEFTEIFRKADGAQVLRRYRQAHVLGFALAEAALLGTSRTSLEILRLAVHNRILRKLRRKYKPFIRHYLKSHPDVRVGGRSDKVWFFWEQGLEAAPEIVARCYRSLKEHLKGKELILLTGENYTDYVRFPAHIRDKIRRGVITRTHMSDLLRLELLLRYGGTWVDATVFCSGDNYPPCILDADLFLFQYLKPGRDGHCTSISSWLITACAGHPILRLTRELLYAYWEERDVLIDYFLFHDCFQLAAEAYPKEWKRVVPFDNGTPQILLLRLFEPFDRRVWDAVTGQTAFHKLTYKFDAARAGVKGTYYSKIQEAR